MQTHILGFPSIGKGRELKRALEAFWRGETDVSSLHAVREALEARHWAIQQTAGLDMVVCGDFSFYDRMLDATLMLGALPARFAPCAEDTPAARYFALARGHVGRNKVFRTLEMTKWFDTNYHYLTPELEADTPWTPGAHPVLEPCAAPAPRASAPRRPLSVPLPGWPWPRPGRARTPGPCWSASCLPIRRFWRSSPRSAR
jgi:5-methyltetrahydropteroyltriglutamate--homocysteine methyltransferase